MPTTTIIITITVAIKKKKKKKKRKKLNHHNHQNLTKEIFFSHRTPHLFLQTEKEKGTPRREDGQRFKHAVVRETRLTISILSFLVIQRGRQH